MIYGILNGERTIPSVGIQTSMFAWVKKSVSPLQRRAVGAPGVAIRNWVFGSIEGEKNVVTAVFSTLSLPPPSNSSQHAACCTFDLLVLPSHLFTWCSFNSVHMRKCIRWLTIDRNLRWHQWHNLPFDICPLGVQLYVSG